MSRKQARENINASDFKKEMENKGILGNFSPSSLDEAPEAYKDIYRVLEMQKKSIKVINHLKPLINWKGERFRGK